MVDITNTDEHLYEMVAADLKKKILNGQFGEDGKIPNYLKLTEMYDVSMSTIKKAMKILNDENVLVSRVGKGTFANKKFLSGAENGFHSSEETNKLGLLVRDLEGPYFSEIYQGLADQMDSYGRKLMITVTRDFYHQEDSLLKMMVSHEVDGLILTTRRKSIYGIRIFEQLKDNNIPAVLLHDVYDSMLPIVDVDNFRGGELAAEQLLKTVKKNFAVVVGEHGYKPDDLRLRGFLEHLKSNGVNVDERCHIFRFSFGSEATAFDEGHKLGLSLDLKNLGLDGIFLFNDLIAMGFQKAMLERGIRIPEDIRMVGFDNIDRCSEARVPLTTVEVPRYEIGKRAHSLLHNLITNRHPYEATKELLEPKLIIRKSG